MKISISQTLIQADSSW